MYKYFKLLVITSKNNLRPDAGIGRQIRLRTVCLKGVEVQVLLGAQLIKFN